MLQNAFFSQSQKMTQRHFFFHPPSPFPGNFCNWTVVAFVLLHNSRFNFHCYTQHEATPTQKSARKWRCDLSWLLAIKITKGINSCKPASLNRPIDAREWCVLANWGFVPLKDFRCIRATHYSRYLSEFRSCVKVEVAVLTSFPS